jgi:hypothetical protein
MQDANSNKETPKGEDCDRAFPPLREPEGAYYLNEKGLLTFTAKYLLARGYCCGNGCKHCPYDYKAVPEPKRSFLLEDRKRNENK